MLKLVSIVIAYFLTCFSDLHSQRALNDKFLNAKGVKSYRLPTLLQKKWTLEITSDTPFSLPIRHAKYINQYLSSRRSSLLTIRIDTDTTLSYTMDRGRAKNHSEKIRTDQRIHGVIWKKNPEYLYKNAFVIGLLIYKQSSDLPTEYLTNYIIARLIDAKGSE